MKAKLLKNEGITLVSLVITIIVMLILAGVSLSMVTGDSSVLKQAQKTAFLQEVATYKEELESEILGQSMEYYAQNRKHLDRSKITIGGSSMKKYIASMKEEDYDKYMIVGGEFYYIGEDEFLMNICDEQNLNTKPLDMTVDEFAAYVESSAIEAIVQKMSNINTVGEALARKTSTSGFGGTNSGWKIITEIANGQNVATYADGWYYVPSGTDVPDIGKVRFSYIINYTTQKAVKFDATKHSIISGEGNLAVSDNLVFNADPTNMDGSATSWGSAKLYGFPAEPSNEENPLSGWTPTSLNFDGSNDYLEIYVDSTFQSEGITIETYGYVDESYLMTFYKGPAGGSASSFKHSISNGKPCKESTSVFQIGGTYIQGIATGGSAQCKQYTNDFHIKMKDTVHRGDAFVTFVLSKTGEYKVYLDGKLILEDAFNKNYAANFQKYISNTGYPIHLGRTTHGNEPRYYKQKLYSLRIYDSLLTADEVLANYNATVSYHNILLNKGEADNNNTGGDDLGSIQ